MANPTRSRDSIIPIFANSTSAGPSSSNINYAALRQTLERDHAEDEEDLHFVERTILLQKASLETLRVDRDDIVEELRAVELNPDIEARQWMALADNERRQNEITDALDNTGREMDARFRAAWSERWHLERQWAAMNPLEDRTTLYLDQLWSVLDRCHELRLTVLNRQAEEADRVVMEGGEGEEEGGVTQMNTDIT